ncbi:hypothetical protein Ga0123461_1275 [Mariprofundus aestuarium]|uniref:Ribbon-helix-helix protein, copG family n=1 Tax=Mariprofundus aestuarium TaxID=1921086 RepID=A0A2K8KXT0_MARES|nr:hypothetical protein Ga0123461_1275 [Mariprofundus aestuarium]
MMFKAPLSMNRLAMRLDNTKIYEIRFRVPLWMKEDLQSYCESHDVPVSHVLRQEIRRILLNSQEPVK